MKRYVAVHGGTSGGIVVVVVVVSLSTRSVPCSLSDADKYSWAPVMCFAHLAIFLGPSTLHPSLLTRGGWKQGQGGWIRDEEPTHLSVMVSTRCWCTLFRLIFCWFRARRDRCTQSSVARARAHHSRLRRSGILNGTARLCVGCNRGN